MLQRKVVYAGTNSPSFQQASDSLRHLTEFLISPKHIERITKAIGGERCMERDVAVDNYTKMKLTKRKGKPAGVIAPEVAAVFVDGGRIQIRDDRKMSQSKSATKAAATESEEEEEKLAPDDRHRGTHWREDKIGLLMTMDSKKHDGDPCPEVLPTFVNPTRISKISRELKTRKSARVEEKQDVAMPTETPEEVVDILSDEGAEVKWKPPEVKEKRLIATRRRWNKVGPMVAEQAYKMGFYQAPRKAFLADGSSHNWEIWRSHFSSFTPVLDIIHAISYVYAAAMAGQKYAVGWSIYLRWVTWVWQGDIEQVIAELALRQAELGPAETSDSDTHPRVVVQTTLGYLQNHKDKMRYADYRREGLPITSSYVESAVKQFNQRVKGTEKFWSESGAEALLMLRSDYISSTNPLDQFWEDRQKKATGQANYKIAA